MQPGQQLFLFEDDYVLLNSAMQHLQNLRLEEAERGFREYRDLYRKGDTVDGMLQWIDFLREGMARDADPIPDQCAHLCRFWQDGEARAESLGIVDKRLMENTKKSYFRNIAEKMTHHGLDAAAFLDEGMPTGYVYLQTGHYKRAVHCLQTCLPSLSAFRGARILAYLGDAYVLSGDLSYARKYYLEALLLNPEDIDWRHVKDVELLALKQHILDDQQIEPAQAAHWLTSYAYVRGMFGMKSVKQLDVIKTLVDEYLQLVRSDDACASNENRAKIFIRSIILCDNEVFLKRVKGMDFADIRRRMKTVNGPLFSDYLQLIEKRNQRAP
jgi:tetratricopeptide (TPR) repeat protein